jgi:hypothetical protein
MSSQSPLDHELEVLQELAKLETLPVEKLSDGLRLSPVHAGGYSVTIRRVMGCSTSSFVVECGPGPWSQAFDTEDEALDLLFACLTADARMTVFRRGTTQVGWQLELAGGEEGSWKPLSVVRRTWVPFWRPETSEHLVNPFLRPPN